MQQSANIRPGRWHTVCSSSAGAPCAGAPSLCLGPLRRGWHRPPERDQQSVQSRSGDVPQRVPQQHAVCEPGQPSPGRHRPRINFDCAMGNAIIITPT